MTSKCRWRPTTPGGGVTSSLGIGSSLSLSGGKPTIRQCNGVVGRTITFPGNNYGLGGSEDARRARAQTAASFTLNLWESKYWSSHHQTNQNIQSTGLWCLEQLYASTDYQNEQLKVSLPVA